MTEKYTWVPFYIELADKILTYKNDRKTLILNIKKAHNLSKKELPKIEVNNDNISDIDPFTVFALFNRGTQSDDARRSLCAGFKNAFNIEADVPSDFHGIPKFNYNQYCFYPYADDEKRDSNCFNTLWELFSEAIGLSNGENNKSKFEECFENALKLHLVALPKITMGLFQVRPNTFVSLDGNTKTLIENKLNKKIYIQNGSDYLRLCSEVNDFIQSNPECNTLPKFSSLAYNKKAQEKAAPTNEWFPAKEEYDPQISKEQWLDFMNNSGLFNDNYKHFLSVMLDIGGQASCAQLANKYGNTTAHYSMTAVHLAEQIATYTNCPLSKDEDGKNRYWTILFVGKYATDDEKGSFIWKMRDELKEALESLNLTEANTVYEEKQNTDVALNTILYGPPGTGKTYNTVIYAVAIIENRTIDSVRAESYSDVVKRYNDYKADGLVEFTTFHQSYGYEEFIEGIKPVMSSDSDEQKDIEYDISSGLFKSFCEKASRPILKNKEQDIGINASPTIWKVSLEGTGSNPTRTECLSNGHIRIGYDGYGENITSETDFGTYGGKNVLDAFIYKMKIGDIVLSCFSSTTIDAIGVVTGDYEWHDEYERYKRLRKVNWLVKNICEDIVEANGSTMTLSSVYRLKISLSDVMAIVSKNSAEADEVEANCKNYVFIIDEINRGNISKIFGELITLIEPTKRIGQTEGASVKLPYSKKPFGVPDNVYLIGTMNTADRSISTIDTALRRRFQFKEMQPDPDILKGIFVEDISIKELLKRMNLKICALYDREHTIGHAYFTCLKRNPTIEALASIFENSIIPLLQEYFFEDYEKIRLVLGDNKKSDRSEQFITKDETNYFELFGNTDFDTDDTFRYELNPSALKNIEAYRYI